jgi:hypothetical protein
MTEGEQQDIQPVSYNTLAAKKIWIKPRKPSLAAQTGLTEIFKWSPAERRLFLITLIGCLAANVGTVLVIGLAIAWVKNPFSYVVVITFLVAEGIIMSSAGSLAGRKLTGFSLRSVFRVAVFASGGAVGLALLFWLMVAIGGAAGLK